MPDNEIAFYLADGGMNGASPGARLPDTQFSRLVNGRIAGEFITTRFGCRVLPLSGDNEEFFRAENVQGATFYNPSSGQSAILYGRDESMIVTAVGGRKFACHLEGRAVTTTLRLEDITNGHTADGNLHLVWFSQWENYVLAQDATGPCIIWDGLNPSVVSAGYNTTDRERSEVPNAATVMCYAHSRGLTVINDHIALVGNLLASSSLTTSIDVLRYTEATYWATSQYFAPPSLMGPITAAAILPLKDTAHGHGAVMLHCLGGIFSVDLNVYPRSNWANSPMVKTAHLGGGATGPYAIDVREGDQFFRSLAGIQSLRSARAESTLLGNPLQPLSDSVRTFMDGDSERFLRFASLTVWGRMSRLFCTVYPIVSGRFRWHRGMIVLNFDPVPEKKSQQAWEGLWTLPPEVGGIVQTVSGTWDREDRFFAICRNAAGNNSVVEFRKDLREDVLEDGTRRRIRCQLISRKLDCKRPFTKKNFQIGSLSLLNILGRVDWGVWFRSFGSRKWVFWQSGYVDNEPCAIDETMRGPQPMEASVTLGAIPDSAGQATSRYVQFLVRWAGQCSVEALRLTYGAHDPDENKFDASKLRMCIPLSESGIAEYNDYEYSEIPESESWLANLKK